MNFTTEAWDWIARIIGAVAGSAISLAYLLPQNLREAASRFFTGLATGLIFGPLAGHKLAEFYQLHDALAPQELSLMGATACSVFAWWGLGIVSRLGSSKSISDFAQPRKKSSAYANQ